MEGLVRADDRPTNPLSAGSLDKDALHKIVFSDRHWWFSSEKICSIPVLGWFIRLSVVCIRLSRCCIPKKCSCLLGDLKERLRHWHKTIQAPIHSLQRDVVSGQVG